MNELPFVFGNTASVLLVLIVFLWIVSVRVRDASIIDIFWGPGFVVIAWVAFISSDGDPQRRLLLTVLTTLWGLRLGLYLALRNLGHGEDPRYRAMRTRCEEKGGNFASRSFFRVYLLQAAVMWFVSLPVQVGQMFSEPDEPGWLTAVGVLLFAVGFLFEATGDWQLARFKRNPENQGKVLATGLWRYTRHPNYFGNTCIWWGLFAIAAENSGAWWTILAPLAMNFLLLKVSGVALLERSLKQSKPDYAAYTKRTSRFLPWPPKG